jgi:lipopolysaccharide/colanic/teichoic acid biosynthesis glycosyltransferase
LSRRTAIPYDYVKRGLDVVLASVVLVASLPIQAVVAVAVARKLGRPVLFKQQRPGRDGEIFTLVKFRTMANASSADAGVDADASRLSTFGQKLRSTSLDELPTLINVLKGDMSMVGPRPLLVQYLSRYTPEQARRHVVRPGVTGLAQVKGRNAIGWDEKFAFDNEYVDNRSLLLDAKILFWTIAAVVKRDGIAAENHVTTHEFMGGPESSGAQ